MYLCILIKQLNRNKEDILYNGKDIAYSYMNRVVTVRYWLCIKLIHKGLQIRKFECCKCFNFNERRLPT